MIEAKTILTCDSCGEERIKIDYDDFAPEWFKKNNWLRIDHTWATDQSRHYCPACKVGALAAMDLKPERIK